MTFFIASVLIANPLQTFATTAIRDVARVTIVGNIGQDAEFRETTDGPGYLTYSVASSRGGILRSLASLPDSSENTDWYRIAVFPTSEDAMRTLSRRILKG
jgi:hypothetical protein